MSCCAPRTEAALEMDNAAFAPCHRTRSFCSPAASSATGCGRWICRYPVVHFGACIATVEGALKRLDGMGGRAGQPLDQTASRRQWPDGGAPPPILQTLAALGTRAHPLRSRCRRQGSAAVRTDPGARGGGLCGRQHHVAFGLGLVRCGCRDARLPHIVSALIRAPRPRLFRPHLLPLGHRARFRHGRSNMDVPISIGVITAYAMSLLRDHDRRRARLFRRPP